MTNHAVYIAALRDQTATVASVAADLLTMHDREAISLDHWPDAVQMISDALESREGPTFVLQRNGV